MPEVLGLGLVLDREVGAGPGRPLQQGAVLDRGLQVRQDRLEFAQPRGIALDGLGPPEEIVHLLPPAPEFGQLGLERGAAPGRQLEALEAFDGLLSLSAPLLRLDDLEDGPRQRVLGDLG